MNGVAPSPGPPPLHVVTDDDVLAGPAFRRLAQRVLAAGGTRLALHLRGPGTDGADLHRLARALRPEARRSGALILANDRVDVALILELAGVHLGERSLPVRAARGVLGDRALIGRSVHGVDGARHGRPGGADYLFVGTIFPSASHPGRPAAGPERVAAVAEATDRPVFGIGGIDPGRVAPVLGAGARGVAVLSGVWHAEDPVGAVQAYLEALKA